MLRLVSWFSDLSEIHDEAGLASYRNIIWKYEILKARDFDVVRSVGWFSLFS